MLNSMNAASLAEMYVRYLKGERSQTDFVLQLVAANAPKEDKLFYLAQLDLTVRSYHTVLSLSDAIFDSKRPISFI